MEDLYRSYERKRRTKATIAKEKGLEPLADWLLPLPENADILAEAATFTNEEKEVAAAEIALQGAHEILAERISDEPKYRVWSRDYMVKHAQYVSIAKDEEKDEKRTYEMHCDSVEPVSKMVSHRVLVMNCGKEEDILKVPPVADETRINDYLQRQLIGK